MTHNESPALEENLYALRNMTWSYLYGGSGVPYNRDPKEVVVRRGQAVSLLGKEDEVSALVEFDHEGQIHEATMCWCDLSPEVVL